MVGCLRRPRARRHRSGRRAPAQVPAPGASCRNRPRR